MTSRAQAPPVNLKERIAALQQRNVSPSPRPTSPSGPLAPPPNSAGLRAKIAKFEKKGGVPVPRGSFGLGAPPLAENGPLKRRGELYGNRIPGAVRASGGGPSASRSGSPFDSTRSFSLPALEGVLDTESTPPPFKALTPNHTGARDPSPRGTPFATALELARRAEANLEASLKPAGLEAAALDERLDGKGEEGADELTHTSTSETEALPLPSPPSIVLSPSGDLEEEQVNSDSTISITMPETAATQVLDTQDSNAVIVEVVGLDAPVSSQEGARIPPETANANVPTEAASVPFKATITRAEEPVKATPAVVEPKLQPDISSSNNKVQATSQAADSKQVEGPSCVAVEQSPSSPMGPFSLANAVHDLGQVVANIHDMFPGQISPLADPPPFRPLRIDTPIEEKSQSPKTLLKSKKSVPDLQLPPHTADVVPVPSMRPDLLRTPYGSEESRLATPRSANGRPVSMIETSPSHIVVAHRVTPLTSRGVPVFLAGKEQQNLQPFPPTPEPDVSEFGTVSMHKPSHSFSHARTYVPHRPGETPSFSAVVHAKVTETAPAPSASYKDFYAKVPETSQANVNQTSSSAETPMSPGYGELAMLLHEAALLELTLEQGELPNEATRQEDLERKQREEQEQKELEKEAAARAKVEEERRKHAAVAKVRAKQEAAESKSKSSFRNPLLRSKNSHKRGISTDSQASRASNEHVRHKPVVQQASPIDSIPETVDVDGDTSSQTSPKSPSRYFTGLRRLASSSRTSISQHSRNSVSASSEISSEDSASIPTPPGNGLYSAGSNGSTAGSERSDSFGGNGIAWPSLSPKKPRKAASFADKILNRGRTKSTDPYDTIDRLTKSRAAKSAAALLPPLDPISFALDVRVADNDLPSPPEELVSPRRSASLYVPSTSSFPPTYATKPTSPVYTPHLTASVDSMLPEKLTSPVYNPHTPAPSLGMQSFDTLFAAKPTSPVYTPHLPAMKSEETITESLMHSPNAASLLPSPQHLHSSNRSSWISGVSDLSMDSSTSSIPSLFDSFPSVPEDMPLPPALPGRQRSFHRPSLPLPAPSFFEPAPLSSAAVGSEFSPAPSAFTRSATLPRISSEHRR